RREVDLEVAVRIPRERADAIALAHAQRMQRGGQALGAFRPPPVIEALEADSRHARGQRLSGEDPACPLAEMRQRERVIHYEVVELSGHRRPPGATSPRSSDVAQRKPASRRTGAPSRGSTARRRVTLSSAAESSWLAPRTTTRPTSARDSRPSSCR